jgi:3-oxoacyl-[acyl-carrier-protein] synthase II
MTAPNYLPVVISGCGWITHFSAGRISDVLTSGAARNDRAGIGRYQPVPGEILEPYCAASAEVRREESVRLTAAALEIALAEAGLVRGATTGERVGLVLGWALAGQSGMIDFANDVREQSPRFVSPIRFPQTVGNYVSGALARAYDLRGPASTIACGSASSLEAIIEGCALLASGAADVVIAGGAERLTPQLVEGLDEPSVEFADGACLFVLERADDAQKRGAAVLGTLGKTPGEATNPTASTEIISTAGYREPEAVFIEAWVGRTLGADGAAALAAAVGAAGGMIVPVVDTQDTASVSPRRIVGGSSVQSSKPVEAVVRVVDDRGFLRELRVLIPKAF